MYWHEDRRIGHEQKVGMGSLWAGSSTNGSIVKLESLLADLISAFSDASVSSVDCTAQWLRIPESKTSLTSTEPPNQDRIERSKVWAPGGACHLS